MSDTEEIISEKLKIDIAKPSRYKVVIINDDKTPMDWVIALLMTKFNHEETAAVTLTQAIHTQGSAVAGTFSYEIAEQKTFESISESRARNYPLQLKVEEDK